MKLLRSRRLEAGLSQAQLARAAGLSRQLVGAVEAGRHAPSVDAALALARALGTTVEELAGTGPPRCATALGDEAVEGEPVAAAFVGDALVYAPLPHAGAGAASWRRADGVVRGGRVELLPGADAAGFVVAGCDPALGLAAALAPEAGPRRVVALGASSGAALESLRTGRLHAALVHGPEGAAPRDGSGFERVTVARWEVGLAARSGTTVELGAIAEGRQVVARRESEAGAQRALERALEGGGGAEGVRGPLADGHIDAARRAATGSADVAVTMRPAARAFGLDFTPLELHVAELLVDPRWRAHPGAKSLGDVLASSAFRERIGLLDGYDLAVA